MPDQNRPPLVQHQPQFTPVAYQDNIDGRHIIARIEDTELYCLLIPGKPPTAPAGEWLLASSIAKHGFFLFDVPQSQIIHRGQE